MTFRIHRSLIPAAMLGISAWLTLASHADKIDDLVKQLGDESHAIREQATRELISRNPDIVRLIRIAADTKNPEIRHRLKVVIGMNSGQWVKLEAADLKKLTPCGKDTANENLYLARAQAGGSTVIGKHLHAWHGGNFPVAEEELMIKDCELWMGQGTWEAWSRKSTKLIPMGITKDHKQVFAARARLNGGVHPGTFIEGETKARIPWGGKVHRLDDFEVLTRNPK